MFDLERSIAEWRRQMLAAGIKTPVPLEELESHLREDIAQQMQSGLSAQQAFDTAAKRIGHAPVLKREFKKIGAPMEMQKIIKLAGVICVTVALFCPLFIFLPFLLAHELSLMTKMLGLAVYATTVATIVFSWRYSHKLLPAICNQPFRRAVGIACYAGCLLWMRFGIFHFSPGGLHPRSIFLPLIIFGLEWTVIAILGGVGHGLEKAASKKFGAIDSLAS
ncbi:MAG: permease prefix domain 1-containing protein [Verrucomicrobiia bacterium]